LHHWSRYNSRLRAYARRTVDDRQTKFIGSGKEMTFGRALLPLWPLDPDAIYLNHGTVGVTPRCVLEAQQRLRDRIEQHPSRFLLREFWSFAGSTRSEPILMRQAAAAVAAFVGANANDLVFVDNTTAGVNAVMQSLRLSGGDDVVISDQAYGGIVAPVRHWAARAGAAVRVAELPYPQFDAAAAVARIAEAMTLRTRLVIAEHIAAETALIHPIVEIVRACHDRGVPVLVDGADVPGQLELNVAAIGADFYVANLHKWAMAPRSAAFMVASPAFQQDLHPPVLSWGCGTGYTQEFDWVGTRDVTPWLAAPDGIRFVEDLDPAAWRRYTHGLAWTGARMLTERWGTTLDTPESSVASMVTVLTPERCGTTKADASRLRDHLLFEHNIEVQVHARMDRVWIRFCAQAYTDMSDVEKLGAAVTRYGC
jgi:isopenicillin-N epimerase